MDRVSFCTQELSLSKNGRHFYEAISSLEFLVNTGHSKEEYDIFLPRQIESAIKPHQIGGVR